MRVLFHFLAVKACIFLVVVSLAEPVHAQRSQSVFRAVNWGMTPDAVQAVEPGTHLRTDSENEIGVERIDAYFDVIRGKIGTVVYGFHEDRLVYGAYRFNLNEEDRAFSQMMGEQIRSAYGESQHVEASDDGRTIHLHWSTPETKVIAQFGPELLRVHFWEANHWSQRSKARTLSTDRPDR